MADSIDAASRSGVDAPDRFRAMMCSFPTGVAVVTATDLAGQPWGMTCSSVCSVTLEPPTLLISLRSASPTLAAILGRGRFTVNLLHDRAWRTAELFASGHPGRFDLIDWDMDADAAGPHLGAHAHAVADCRVGTTVPASDHTVVFGEAYRISLRPGHPLLYGLRGYRRWPSAEPTN